jgi:hypothetical protein
MSTETPITEDWLREVGFKWHQLERQPSKQWLLWLGDALRHRGNMISNEDLGIELAQCWWKNSVGGIGGTEGEWFCWLRADTSHRYSRFLHVRHLRYQDELIRLIEALTGIEWKPENNIGGSMQTQKNADWFRAEYDRLDRRMLRENYKHREIEKDDSMGGALPQHLEAHEKAKSGAPQ